jgi:predicted Zn-dependent protease
MSGGAVASEDPHRAPPTVNVGTGSLAKGGEVAAVEALKADIETVDVGRKIAVSDVRHPGTVRPGLRRSVEEFVGWGLPDWIDGVGPTSNDFEEQVRLVTELVKIDPDHPYVMAVVGNLSYLSEDYTLAEEIHRRFVRLHPEQPGGWNNLALIYKRRGLYVEEERLYRRALTLDPESPSSQINLAVNLAHQGRFSEAEALMDNVRPDKSRRAYADLHRAKIAAAQGQDKKAFRLLKKALSEVSNLDTMLHIEFRQDLRLEPSFAALRKTRRFNKLVAQAYGDGSGGLLGASRIAGGDGNG